MSPLNDQLPYGKKGTVFVLTSMFITAYGAMVAYLLIIKDTLPVVLGLNGGDDGNDGSNSSFVERELVMLVTSLVIVVPLSMARDFSTLAFTSFLSVLADLFLVVFVAVMAPVEESVRNAGGIGAVLKGSGNEGGNGGFFIGFGVLTIAMTCQHSAFIVSGSMERLTSARWGLVTCRSLSASAVLCLVLGITGYLGFLGETKGDVLNNFSPDGTGGANVARALLAFTMFFTYPMEAFVARHVLVQLLYGGDMDENDDEHDGNHHRHHHHHDDDDDDVATTHHRHDYDHNDDPTAAATGETTTTTAATTTTTADAARRWWWRWLSCGWKLNRRHRVTLGIYVLTLVPALLLDDLGESVVVPW